MTQRCAAVVLAGGESRRFGTDKLAAQVDGRLLLDSAIAGLPEDAVVIVVGPQRPVERAVRFVREQPAGGGPATALVTGLAEALTVGADRIVVLPGDAPAAGRAAMLLLDALAAAPGVTAVVGTDATGFEQPLQLALLPEAAAALVEAAGPDRARGGSARSLVHRLTPPAVPHRLPTAEHWDIDTPEQLRAWSVRDSPAVQQIVDAVANLATRKCPVLLALDGASGAGKSLLASALALKVSATVVQGDDFYNPALALLTSHQRERIPDSEVAQTVFDWRRLRTEALEPLMRGESARYRPYDWAANDGRLGRAVDLAPADLIIVEGVYSSRPELADLVDLTVRVEVSERLRRQRLDERGNDVHRRSFWQRGEHYYFTRLRPPGSFDLHVQGGAEAEIRK
jgi:molybdopterin-guanine dinucleotide biosynthesis protein A/uridine kinase